MEQLKPEQLHLLWYLQERDLAILELEKQLREDPLVSEIPSDEKKVQVQRDIIHNVEQDLKEKYLDMKKTELKLQKANDEIKNLKHKLYGGVVSNIKELSQMEKKLEIVEKEREVLENQVIEKLEKVEELEKKNEMQRKILRQNEAKLVKKQEKANSKIKELKIQEQTMEDARDEILAQVTEKMLEQYKNLCRRPGNRGISRVKDGLCEGCRVFISSAQRGQLYNPKTMVYCENCGRLLIRMPEDHDEKSEDKTSDKQQP